MTTRPREKLVYVHEGKAAYPEIEAGGRHFGRMFDVESLHATEARALPDLADATCWHMMGLYVRRLPARRVIHDYRSLSVGRAAGFKDRLKRYLNHRPDLRIYQNEEIRAAMGFADGVPELLLPMGVPDDIVGFRDVATAQAAVDGHDFCYIGSMLAERRMDVMIDSFLKRFGATRNLHLYGTPNPVLVGRYAAHRNVTFQGPLPQRELFERLGTYSAAVNYFPNHFPHVLQTPTKMLEYAALGMRIVANEQPQSRKAAERYGIACCWGPADDMFAAVSDTLDWPDNATLDPQPMLWTSIYRASGIDDIITPGR